MESPMNTQIPADQAIKDFHACFCHETGAQLRLGIGEYSRERAWATFLKTFTKEDLRLVLRYLRHEIREGNRRPGCLKFSNVIEQLDRFEEDLQLARAAERNQQPKRNQEERMIAERKPAPPTNAKPIGDYIAALRKAAE